MTQKAPLRVGTLLALGSGAVRGWVRENLPHTAALHDLIRRDNWHAVGERLPPQGGG
jgi:hypothetical protein